MSQAASWLDQSLLKVLRKIAGPAPVRFGIGNCAEEDSRLDRNDPCMQIVERKTMWRMLLNPEMAFGDGYAAGKIRIEGDLVRLLEALYKSPSEVSRAYRRALARLAGLTRHNSLRGSRENIHDHYDLGNDFYKLWLDPELAYTCAYFPTEDHSIADAQKAKFDHVCRKVWLKPGDSVVEAGCGWGGLALHMARHYGARVRAFNISREQIAYARERAKLEGLDDQVEFIEDDYRDIRGRYDVFMSVGMLEHVGPENFKTLGQLIHRVIGSTGRGLLHFIGRNSDQPFSQWIRRRIFPGAYPPSLRAVADVFEPVNFSVLDVENLRLHYAKTLEFWLGAFERSYDLVVKRYGENFARAWQLYLAGSIAAFRVGSLQLFQVVFAGADCQIPWNRAYLYDKERRSKESWIPAAS